MVLMFRNLSILERSLILSIDIVSSFNTIFRRIDPLKRFKAKVQKCTVNFFDILRPKDKMAKHDRSYCNKIDPGLFLFKCFRRNFSRTNCVIK